MCLGKERIVCIAGVHNHFGTQKPKEKRNLKEGKIIGFSLIFEWADLNSLELCTYAP